MKNGSRSNVSEMKLVTHTGTHVDAPGHMTDEYFDAGFDVDTLDLLVLNGEFFYWERLFGVVKVFDEMRM
ncbi:putative kynurenine formamidase/cyclase, kynurenine formamidase superfamily [Helianthus debilis subsp. tardiflorus]